MYIGQVMIADVSSCSPDESLRTAAERLQSSDCGTLPVVGKDGRVVGMLTDRDICMAALAQDRPLSALKVKDSMSHPPQTCSSEDVLATAERAMREHQVRRLPVVDASGALVGIISIDDLAREALRKGSVLDTRGTLETLVFTSHYKPFERGRIGPGGGGVEARYGAKRKARYQGLEKATMALAALREEARLKLHLAGMEARTLWEEELRGDLESLEDGLHKAVAKGLQSAGDARVQAHLGLMEARTLWETLEPRVSDTIDRIRVAARRPQGREEGEVTNALLDLFEAARQAIHTATQQAASKEEATS